VCFGYVSNLSKNTLKTSGVSPRMKAYQPKAGNTNTSREVKKEFEWLRKIYWGSDFWSSGFFLRQLALMKK
jgi:REP element-mobilizing transposase RayT